MHQKHGVSVRPSGRRGRRASVHRVDSRCDPHVGLPHGRSLVRVDVRVGRARHSHQRCIRPSDRHVGDVNAHHARNPNDHRVE